MFNWLSLAASSLLQLVLEGAQSRTAPVEQWWLRCSSVKVRESVSTSFVFKSKDASLCHRVEGLARPGSRAAVEFTAPRLQNIKSASYQFSFPTYCSWLWVSTEMCVCVGGDSPLNNTVIKLQLPHQNLHFLFEMMHPRTKENMSKGNFLYPSCIHSKGHTPGDHLVLVSGCDSRMLCCSTSLQIG